MEIGLDSGLLRYSFAGDSATQGFYEPEVLSISPITKAIGITGGGYQTGTVTITVKNTNRRWQQIKANEPTRNRIVRVFHHSTDDPAERIAPCFVGKIDSIDIAGASASLTCRDVAFEQLDQLLSTRLLAIDSATFPDLPEGATYSGLLAPVFYANHDLALPADGNYRFPAYLIDPAQSQANYRYLIAQHACVPESPVSSSIVRRYGGAWTGSTPVLTTATYGGVVCAVLDFASDQRDTARPDELEITHRLRGKADSVGSPISAPSDIFYDFMVNFAPLGSSFPGDLDGTLAAEAAAAQDADLDVAAVWIGGDPAQAYTDFIRNYQDSFPAVIFPTRYGALGQAAWTTTGTRHSTLEYAGQTGQIQLGEDREIMSFRVSNPEEANSRLRLSFNYHPVDTRYLNWEPTTNAAFESYLGEVRQALRTAVYMQAAEAPISDTILALMSPLNDIFEMNIPSHWWARTDIDRLVQVTHREIPSSMRSEMLKDAPSLLLEFGEKRGVTAVGLSGNGLDGAYISGFTLGKPGPCVGEDRTAVQLDGTTGYINVADDPLLDPGDTFTQEICFNLAAIAGSQIMFDKGTDGCSLYINLNGTVVAYKRGVGASIVTSSVNVSAGSWNHLALTKDGSTTNAYLNGMNVTVAGTNQTIVANANDLMIGNDGAGSFAGGSLAMAALYPTALSAERIRAHHLSRLAKFSPTVVARIIGLELNLNPEELGLLVRALHVKTSLGSIA